MEGWRRGGGRELLGVLLEECKTQISTSALLRSHRTCLALMSEFLCHGEAFKPVNS